MKLALFACGVIVSSCLLVGCDDDSPTNPSGSNVSVSIVANSSSLTSTAYSPNPITVTRGSTVTWTNNDTVTHTATADSGSWNSGGLAPGTSYSTTYQIAGTYPYHCTIHPNMVGSVIVQ